MSVKNIWDKTKGYKTASGGVLLLLFQAFKLIWPQAMGQEWQEFTYNAIGVVTATGVVDKVWRNRKTITGFVKRIFKRKSDAAP